ncbi:hypothetical protein [Streptodolium elevatio]
MGDIETPELLPDSAVLARHKRPDDGLLKWLAHIADTGVDEPARVAALRACAVRGGTAAAAASFIVQTVSPWRESLQRIADAAGFDTHRPRFTAEEYTVGLRYVAGAKGLPMEFRHRAVDELVHRDADAGYAEARSLLPKNEWQWLADAVRDGWGRLVALEFLDDSTAPMALRVRVGLAFVEHADATGYVLDLLTRLVMSPDAASADRLAIAMAVVERNPTAGIKMLSVVAADPLVQSKHRMQAIEHLDTADPDKSLELRALQTRLPSARVARERQRDATAQAKQEAERREHQSSANEVMRRLDGEIAEILEDLRGRGSADWLADNLDDHIAEDDGAAVSEDISDMCALADDDEIRLSLHTLKVLHRIRYGDEAAAEAHSTPEVDLRGGIPRLTHEDVVGHARQQAESAWRSWQRLVEKHGWNHDRVGEVAAHVEAIGSDVADSVAARTGNHLRELRDFLVDETWPALVEAAEARDHPTVHGLLAEVRAIGDELITADKLWRTGGTTDFDFDPLSLSWPHEFWVVLDEWRRAGRPVG